MHRQEITEWFDKAFASLYQADFAAAAACFQFLIEHADDLYVIQIARRDLKLCFPLQELEERLQKSPFPLSLNVLLEHGKYPAELVSHLRKFRSIYELDDEWWVADGPFRAAIKQTLSRLFASGQPITLGLITQYLFADRGLHLTLSPNLAFSLSAIIPSFQETYLIEKDCLFTKTILNSFVLDVAKLVRAERKPQSLSDAIAMTPWPSSVTTELDSNSLGQVINLKKIGELVEIAPDLWVTNDFIDGSSVYITEAFTEPYTSLTSEEILLRLISISGRNLHLNASYVHQQAALMQRNPGLVAVHPDRWLSRESFDSLINNLLNQFVAAGIPILPTTLVRDLSEFYPPITTYHKSLLESLITRIERDANALHVTETAWLHRSAMSLLLDHVYEKLQGHALTIKQLGTEIIGPFIENKPLRTDFASALTDAFRADDRFLLDKNENWQSLPPGNRLNNPAYRVLYEQHRPLTRREIAEFWREYRGHAIHFEMTGDTRFRQSPDARWMLADWIWLNDLAAQFLATIKTPQSRTWIVEHTCERNSLPPANAIFEPERDGRFIKDPFGRWLCTSAGTILTVEMLDYLVENARSRLWGVPLNQMIHDAFHRPVSDFLNLEQTLLDDNRLIACEGLWYPREAIRILSTEDVSSIKAYLTTKPHPVSSVELAETCLESPLCLTNLNDALRLEPDLIRIADAAWLLQANQSAAVGRRREINYPIHSGKYIPILSADQLVEPHSSASVVLDSSMGKAITTAKPPPQHVMITLTYEDIRDGSIVVSSHLRQFLESALDLPGFRFVDNSYTEFLCWFDSNNNLIHGLGPWFQYQELTYGDKVRLSLTRAQDRFSIEKTGERNDQIFHEGQRRNQIEDWRKEALRSDRSYYDLVLEVLDHFQAPLHVDDIYSLVDVRRTARKNTISAILSSQPYFVSMGRGYWRFDEQEYLKMIRELQTQVASLNRQKSDLQIEIEQHREIVDENKSLLEQNTTLTRDLAQAQAQLIKTRADLVGAQEINTLLKDELKDWPKERVRLVNELEASGIASQALRTSLDENASQLIELKRDLATREEALRSFEEDLQMERRISGELRITLGASNLELETTQHELNESKIERENVISQIAEREDVIKSLQASLDQKVSEIAGLQSEIEKYQDEINTLNLDLTNTKNALQNAKRESATIYDELEKVRSENGVQSNDLAVVQANLNAEKTRAESLQQELESKTTDFQETINTVSRIKQTIEDLSERNKALDTQMKSLTQLLDEKTVFLLQSENRIVQLERDLSEEQKTNGVSQDQNSNLSTRLEHANSELMAMEREYRTVMATNSEIHDRVAQFEDLLKQRGSELESANQFRSALENEVIRLRGERNDVAQRNEKLTKEVEGLSLQNDQSAAILNSHLGHLARWWTGFISNRTP